MGLAFTWGHACLQNALVWMMVPEYCQNQGANLGLSSSPSQSSNRCYGPVPFIACKEAHVGLSLPWVEMWCWLCALISLEYFSAGNAHQGAGVMFWLISHTASAWQRGTEGQVRTLPCPCQVGKGLCHILLASRDEWAVRTSLHLRTMSRGWAGNKQLFLLP